MNFFKNKASYTKYVDLHLHTSFSDGTLSPEEIVMEANSLGFSAIAITDHDTLDGIEPALLAGERFDVEVIPGLELSAESEDEEVHILGYYIDWQNLQLQKKLQEFRESRRTRAMKMVDKLNELGMHLEYGDVLSRADPNSIGRPHVAAALVENGYVTTMSEAFYKFLGNNGPAYVAKQKLSPAEAVKMVLDAGGIPVFAHPGMQKRDILEELMSAGLMGLEAFHPEHTIQLSNHYRNLAEQYDLLITGGSDYHGFGKKFMGSIRLPYKYVDDLKTARDDKL